MTSSRLFRTLSLPIPTFEALNVAAKSRGMSKAKLIEDLLSGDVSRGPAADRHEALQLLSDSARNGKVAAQVALVRALGTAEPSSGESDPLDELADRRRGA